MGGYNVPHFIAQSIKGGVDYSTDSFEPIANWGSDPAVFVVGKDSNFNSMSDVVDFAKANPGKPNVWNEMLITLNGKQTTVHVNGVLVTDFMEGDVVPEKKLDYEPNRGPRPDFGYIGLQNHGENDVIYFKEVSLKAL